MTYVLLRIVVTKRLKNSVNECFRDHVDSSNNIFIVRSDDSCEYHKISINEL